MKIEAAVLVTLMVAMAADAGEFRRIESIEAEGRGGRLVLEDWDGDGDLELIRGDTLFQHERDMASLDLLHTQIYEVRDGNWAASHAFVHRNDQFYAERADLPGNEESTYSLDGDFTGDGIADTLVAEPATENADKKSGRSYVLRLKQEGKTLFEDTLYALPGPTAQFSRFQVADLDGDGAQEVLVWLLGYRSVDQLVVYGNQNSKWHNNNTFDVPFHLTEAIQFVRGVKSAAPGKPSPVVLSMKPAAKSELTKSELGKEEIVAQFRVDFAARDEGKPVDLAAWREYFAKWAVGYQVNPAHVRPNPLLLRQALGMDVSQDGESLLVAMRFQPEENGTTEMNFGVQLECPVMEGPAGSLGWTGTLQTPVWSSGLPTVLGSPTDAKRLNGKDADISAKS